MSLERLPENIEQGVQEFADQRHLSHDEAVLELIKAGLTISGPKRAEQAASEARGLRIPGLPDEPMSDEDAAMMDEIVAEAMQARRQRWERYLSA